MDEHESRQHPETTKHIAANTNEISNTHTRSQIRTAIWYHNATGFILFHTHTHTCDFRGIMVCVIVCTAKETKSLGANIGNRLTLTLKRN